MDLNWPDDPGDEDEQDKSFKQLKIASRCNNLHDSLRGKSSQEFHIMLQRKHNVPPPKSEFLRHQKWRLDPWQEPKWSSAETPARWPSRGKEKSSHMPLNHGLLMQRLCNEQWYLPIFAFE